jgi:hypothetical protein
MGEIFHMTTTTLVQIDGKPPIAADAWYNLAVVRRLALGIVVHIIGATPLAKYLAGADLAPYVDQILEIVGVAIDSWAMHARVTKPCPMVARSAAHAAVINAAVALNAALVPAPAVSP